jgi:hypothetical protein
MSDGYAMSALDPRRSWFGCFAVASVVLTLALAWLQPTSSEGRGALETSAKRLAERAMG